MKLVLNFLAAASLVIITSGVGYSANAGPADFEQRKAEQIRRLDNRIRQLEDETTCISAATTREAMRTCREQAKPAQKFQREHT